ncbi:allophanate hydrolase-related protein [Microcoleus sp. S36a_D3]|uniref:allophanate hydrolase-related protein n=1 Tax=unclassified Microcoleus TaxID=2642155 RepID=UPI003FA5A8FF
MDTDTAGSRGVPAAFTNVEVWEWSIATLGRFVAQIKWPLGIGTLMLEDGSMVQGFLCESYAVAGAMDISNFGG